MIAEKDKSRFLKYVFVEESGCWRWTGAVSKRRKNKDERWYGRFWFKNKNMSAHRLSWIIHIGEIPKGLIICHKCDNTRCVNPAHLFVGTQQDNVTDMINKNRHSFPPRIREIDGKPARAKLNDAQIVQLRLLRKSGMTQLKIGKLLGVSQITVSKILLGKIKYALVVPFDTV